MGVNRKPDFSGWATKAGLKCTDGRVIMTDAFKHQDQTQVPFVWSHKHNGPDNVLGHAILTNKAEGVWCDLFCNEAPQGKNAKLIVQHGDVDSLSIWANGLVEKMFQGLQQVFHGSIKEVSLVLAGANPGAKIDPVTIMHADGDVETLDDEAIIYTGLPLELEHDGTGAAAAGTKTVQDVYDSLDDEQRELVHFMIGTALEDAGLGHSEETDEEKTAREAAEAAAAETNEEKAARELAEKEAADKAAAEGDKPAATAAEGDLAHQEGTGIIMSNVFEIQDGKIVQGGRPKSTLTHAQIATIVEDAETLGSLKKSFLAHTTEYGIENIDYLFPDYKTITSAPELVSRRLEWVSTVLNGVKKNPLSRIKTVAADITHDEARAKGYVKASLKKEEWFGLTKRTTGPTTVYKKQKLDRDDIVDITDLDVVVFLKGEMRIMLDEELARAILIGDGREIDDEDKIDETCIRPVAFDDDFYTHKVTVAANVVGDALIEAVLRARPYYRGSGNPTAFMAEDVLTDLILIKDKMGRRLYPTTADVAAAMRVSNIVTLEQLGDVQTDAGSLQMVLLNLSDYTLGADKGGEVNMFDDFDIDYNQFKYLIETRVSGSLTKFKSAIAIMRANGTEVTPATPTFVTSTGVLTVPATAHVVYHNQADDSVLSSGAQTAIAAGATISVYAVPAAGYYFPHNFDADWDFTRDA